MNGKSMKGALRVLVGHVEQCLVSITSHLTDHYHMPLIPQVKSYVVCSTAEPQPREPMKSTRSKSGRR